MSFYRHSLHDAVERRAFESRERARRAVLSEHYDRHAVAAKVVIFWDRQCLSRRPPVNPYSPAGAAVLAAMFEILPEVAWAKLARDAGVPPLCELARDDVIDAYRVRSRSTGAGVERQSLTSLRVYEAALAEQIAGAGAHESEAQWLEQARATQREVAAEIEIRARRAAS